MVSTRRLVAKKDLLELEFMPFMGKNQKKSLKTAFFFKKIWSVQKFVVPLQPLSRERAFSSAGLEHLPYKQRVRGSNP